MVAERNLGSVPGQREGVHQGVSWSGGVGQERWAHLSGSEDVLRIWTRRLTVSLYVLAGK